MILAFTYYNKDESIHCFQLVDVSVVAAGICRLLKFEDVKPLQNGLNQ